MEQTPNYFSKPQAKARVKAKNNTTGKLLVTFTVFHSVIFFFKEDTVSNDLPSQRVRALSLVSYLYTLANCIATLLRLLWIFILSHFSLCALISCITLTLQRFWVCAHMYIRALYYSRNSVSDLCTQNTLFSSGATALRNEVLRVWTATEI